MPHTKIIVSAKDMASSTFRKIRLNLSDVTQQVFSLQTALSGLGLGYGLKSLFEAGRSDSARVRAFTQIAGGAQEAQRELDFLRRTSDELGQDFHVLSDSYKEYFAAAKQVKMETRDMREVFVSITRAGAVMGLSSEQISGALTAVQQMISKGKVSAEELRQQLGERLPGALGYAAEAMGLTLGQLDKLMSSGKLTANELLPRLARVLNVKFSGGADAATAALNKWNECWRDTKVLMAESGFMEEASRSMKEITTMLRDKESLKSLQSLGKGFGKLATGAADTAIALGKIVNSLSNVPPEVLGALAGGALGWKVTHNKYGALGGAAIGLGFGFGYAQDERNLSKGRRKKMEEQEQKALSSPAGKITLFSKEELAHLQKNLRGGVVHQGAFYGYGEWTKSSVSDSAATSEAEAEKLRSFLKKQAQERLTFEQNLSKDLARVSMGRFEFQKWELGQEVELARETARKIAQQAGRTDQERAEIRKGYFKKIEEYETGSLARISKEQQEQAAELSKQLSEQNARLRKEMETQLRETMAASDSTMAGMRLGLMEYRDSLQTTGRAVANSVRETMQSTTEEIRHLLHGTDVEAGRVFENIIANFERLAIERSITTPMADWFGSALSGSSGWFPGFRLPGFADGGISHGPQLAWVSEGRYRSEAHVPLPDGRAIPVNLNSRGGDVSVSIPVEIHNHSSAQVQTRETVGQDGRRRLMIMIGSDIAQGGPVMQAIERHTTAKRRVR